MALPDFVDLILTRLQLNFSEIAGVKRAYKQAPLAPLGPGDYPAMIPLVGGLVTPIPTRSAGAAFVARQFICRLLIAPIGESSLDATDDGAQAMNDAIPFLGLVIDYLLDHPRLNTASLPSLAYVHQDVLIQDSGPTVRPGPGGAQYCAIDFTLTVECRAPLTPGRIS